MNKGFTLIELLIAIAIIGILASIILVAMPSSTQKANSARIISAISQARSVMMTVYGEDGNYSNFSEITPDTEMVPLNDEITAKGGLLKIIKCADCGTDGAPTACMYSNIPSGGFYCADSTGLAGKRETNPNTDTCLDDETSANCGTVN